MKTNNVIVVDDESNETRIELLDKAKKTILDVQRSGGHRLIAKNQIFLHVCFQNCFHTELDNPEIKGKIKVSFEKCIQYYLKLSPRLFSKHPFFVLILFYMISKERDFQNAYYKLNITPAEAYKIQNITAEEMVEYLDRKCQKLKSFINEDPTEKEIP